jgi:hypothetical protein
MKKKERAREDQADATVDESISAASSLTKKVHGKVRIFEETKKSLAAKSGNFGSNFRRLDIPALQHVLTRTANHLSLTTRVLS